jgi:hypothetical protein
MREAAASSVHRGGLESCTPLLVIGVGGIATNHEHPGQCAVVQMPVVNRKVAADQQQYVIDDISVHCKLHDSHGTVVASPACERTSEGVGGRGDGSNGEEILHYKSHQRSHPAAHEYNDVHVVPE